MHTHVGAQPQVLMYELGICSSRHEFLKTVILQPTEHKMIAEDFKYYFYQN